MTISDTDADGVNNRIEPWPDSMRCPVIGCTVRLPVDWSDLEAFPGGGGIVRYTAYCERHKLEVRASMNAGDQYPFTTQTR